MDKIQDGGAYVLFPADPPKSSTLKSNDLRSKDVACKSWSLEGNIKDFYDGFEEPKVHNAGDIIKWNEENSELAMPERKCKIFNFKG